MFAFKNLRNMADDDASFFVRYVYVRCYRAIGSGTKKMYHSGKRSRDKDADIAYSSLNINWENAIILI
jgi:hypothetical protein